MGILKDTSTMYTINLLVLISFNLVRSLPVDNKLTDQCKSSFYRCCDTSSSIIPYRCFELNKCTPQFIKPENYLKICKEIHGNDTVKEEENAQSQIFSNNQRDDTMNEEDTKGLKDEENARRQISSNNQRDDTVNEEDTKGLKDEENAQSQISSNNQRDDTMNEEDTQKFEKESKRDYYPTSSPK